MKDYFNNPPTEADVCTAWTVVRNLELQGDQKSAEALCRVVTAMEHALRFLGGRKPRAYADQKV